MAFLRFSRDKRGYEHTYLVHESGGRGRAPRARVLYWFRTPPGIKVGRAAFDDEARQKIESHNPGIAFDWKAIVSTPIPPVPEVEHWRERRRIERAAKLARREEQNESEDVEPQGETAAEPVYVPEAPRTGPSEPIVVSVETTVITAPGSADPSRKRRRRRGGRRRAAADPGAAPARTDGSTEPMGMDGPAREDAPHSGVSSEGADPQDLADSRSDAGSDTSQN